MMLSKKVAPEPGKFRIDYPVAFLHDVHKFAEFALVVVLCSADCLLNPAVNAEILSFSEIADFKTLVFDRLPVA